MIPLTFINKSKYWREKGFFFRRRAAKNKKKNCDCAQESKKKGDERTRSNHESVYPKKGIIPIPCEGDLSSLRLYAVLIWALEFVQYRRNIAVWSTFILCATPITTFTIIIYHSSSPITIIRHQTHSLPLSSPRFALLSQSHCCILFWGLLKVPSIVYCYHYGFLCSFPF